MVVYDEDAFDRDLVEIMKILRRCEDLNVMLASIEASDPKLFFLIRKYVERRVGFGANK
jgi:hypothetical protein